MSTTIVRRGSVRPHTRLDQVMHVRSAVHRPLQRSGYTPMGDDDLVGILEMFEDDYGRCRSGCVGDCPVTGVDDPDGRHEPVLQMVQAMRIPTLMLLMYEPIPGGKQTVTELCIENVLQVPDGLNVLVPQRIGPGGKQIGERFLIRRNPASKILCPVASLSSWLHLLAEEGLTSGPVFRSVNRHRNTYMKGTAQNPIRAGETVTLSESGLTVIVRRTCEQAVERGYLRPGTWGLVSLLLGASVRAVRDGRDVDDVAEMLNFSPRTVQQVVDETTPCAA
jgi:hypothetical protein